MAAALERQRAAREMGRAKARGADGGGQGGGEERKAEAEDFAKAGDVPMRLAKPEWVLAPPDDLAGSWMCAARPAGGRVLAVAARGATTLRGRNGARMGVVRTPLPGGGGAEDRRTRGATILDCIRDAATGELHALDVLVWNGHDMRTCAFEMRHFWLAARLAELSDSIVVDDDAGGGGNADDAMDCGSGEGPAVRIVALPFLPATQDAVEAAVVHAAKHSRAEYGREPATDGLLFQHRLAWYASDAVTPLSLVWKDDATSAWYVETPPRGTPANAQRVVLRYDMKSGALLTSDDPPVRIARLVARDGDAVDVVAVDTSDEAPPTLIADGALARIDIFDDGADVAMDDGREGFRRMRFVGVLSGKHRASATADIASKISFQHAARTGTGVTAADLIAAAADALLAPPDTATAAAMDAMGDALAAM